jgi:hypothetical protein
MIRSELSTTFSESTFTYEYNRDNANHWIYAIRNTLYWHSAKLYKNKEIICIFYYSNNHIARFILAAYQI